MPKIPSSRPDHAPVCDPRLPEAALEFRLRHGLTQPAFFNALNVTAWLYREPSGETKVQVNPNVPIRDLVQQFGPAATPDAEVGFHSEMLAAQWFLERPTLRVLQLFTERAPCRGMCAPMLQRYFAHVPWYYYYDRASWRGPKGKVLRSPGEVLPSAYSG